MAQPSFHVATAKPSAGPQATPISSSGVGGDDGPINSEQTLFGSVLEKKSGMRGNWQPRWFQLNFVSATQVRLDYYKDEAELKKMTRLNKPAKEFVDLLGSQEILSNSSPYFVARASTAPKKSDYEIELETTERIFRLRAESQEKCDAWLSVLNSIGNVLGMSAAYDAKQDATQRTVRESFSAIAATVKKLQAGQLLLLDDVWSPAKVKALVPSLRPTTMLRQVTLAAHPRCEGQLVELVPWLSSFCGRVQNFNLKDGQVGKEALESFITACRNGGGCQMTSLNLRGNSAAGDVVHLLQTWPAEPIVIPSLSGHAILYSSVGMLQKLCLDDCKMSVTAASSMMSALLFHAANLKGLSMVRAIASASASTPKAGSDGKWTALVAATVRKGLSTKSKEVRQLKSGTVVQVFEQGESEGHQRVRIGKNEWVSAVTAKGRVLISPPANPQGSSARLPQSEAAGFFSALSDFLNTSQVLQVLDLSENGLPLDFFPRAAKAPLQVLTLSGNHFVADTTALCTLVTAPGPVSRSLELLSLTNMLQDESMDITALVSGMAASRFMLDLSGCGSSKGRRGSTKPVAGSRTTLQECVVQCAVSPTSQIIETLEAGTQVMVLEESVHSGANRVRVGENEWVTASNLSRSNVLLSPVVGEIQPAENLSPEDSILAYCSWCQVKTTHILTSKNMIGRNQYLCTNKICTQKERFSAPCKSCDGGSANFGMAKENTFSTDDDCLLCDKKQRAWPFSEVQVPPGSFGGAVFRVTAPNGQIWEAMAPANTQALEVISIELPAATTSTGPPFPPPAAPTLLEPAATVADGPRMLLVRDCGPDEACAIIESPFTGACVDLDLRPHSGVAFPPRFSHGLAVLLSQPSNLTSLNISRAKLGAGLEQAVAYLATNTNLLHLDVSGAGETGLGVAMANALKTNRTLTSLKMVDNRLDFAGYKAMRQLFGGVNAQTGVIFGNKKLLILDITSPKNVEELMETYKRKVQEGTERMASGARVIKSAYKLPYTANYRRPNEPRKRAGIVQKTSGKNLIRVTNRDKDKLKVLCTEIDQLLKRNQNLLSLKEQQKMGDTLAKVAGKAAVHAQKQKAKYQARVNKMRAQRLAKWDAKMRDLSNIRPGCAYYKQWRSEHAASFHRRGWTALKDVLPLAHVKKLERLIAATETMIAQEEEMQQEVTKALADQELLKKKAAAPQPKPVDPSQYVIQGSAKMVMMQVQIPNGVVQGQSVQLQLPSGQMTSFQVPAGATPGMMIQLQVPSGGSGGGYQLNQNVLGQDRGLWQNSKQVSTVRQSSNSKSRKSTKGRYESRNNDSHVYGYGYGYGYGSHYGSHYGYDRYGYDRYGYDRYGYDRYGYNRYGGNRYGYHDDYYYNDHYHNDDYYAHQDNQEYVDTPVDPAPEEEAEAEEEVEDLGPDGEPLIEDAPVEDAFELDDGEDSGDGGGGDGGGDDEKADDGGDGDLAEVAAYGSAGPRRWWGGSGSGFGGPPTVPVQPPRPPHLLKSGNTHPAAFENWFDKTWAKMESDAFHTAVLGRPHATELSFRTESFRLAQDQVLAPSSEITLCTQGSIDRLRVIEEQARAWQGRVSLGVYVKAPEEDFALLAAMHSRLQKDAPRVPSSSSVSMEITVLHALTAAEISSGGLTEYDQLYHLRQLHIKTVTVYPINALRNLAAAHARTDLLFLVDCDFIPSRELAKLAADPAWRSSVAADAAGGTLSVVPAFETSSAALTMPRTQTALRNLGGEAEGFHVSRFPKGHGPTDFARWATANEKYEVEYAQSFEPYVIGSRSTLPIYDERFRGYGHNKIVHLLSCHMGGLKFAVLPHVFVCAAEHARSDSWAKIYDTRGGDEHQVQIAALVTRVKEELAAEAPPLLPAFDSPEVARRRGAVDTVAGDKSPAAVTALQSVVLALRTRRRARKMSKQQPLDEEEKAPAAEKEKKAPASVQKLVTQLGLATLGMVTQLDTY